MLHLKALCSFLEKVLRILFFLYVKGLKNLFWEEDTLLRYFFYGEKQKCPLNILIYFSIYTSPFDMNPKYHN